MNLRPLVAGCLCLFAISIAGQTNHTSNATDETVIAASSAASLQDWFKLIESHGIILSYNPARLDMDRIKTVKRRRLTVGDLLASILGDYRYKIIPGESNKLILSIDGEKDVVISGHVKEAVSGEKLYGAYIIFGNGNSRRKIATANDNGQYAIGLQPGDYTVEVHYLGFSPFKKKVSLHHNTTLDISLTAKSYDLDEVAVKEHPALDEMNETAPSNMLSFNANDVFSRINLLPGVSGSIPGGNFHVNGGSDDENLVLLDGVPIYHPNHINPLLTAVNGDAIKNITFHKYFFPAEYEGRLSSVTDIKFKEGNKQKYTQTLTLDMPAASVVAEGPIVKDKLSYIIGGRRSWLDLFNRKNEDIDKLNHTFYDMNVKLSYDITPRSNLQAMAYTTSDHYLIPKEDGTTYPFLKWRNSIYALKFSTLIGKKLINTSALTYSSYSNKVYALFVGYDVEKYIKGGINSISFSSDFNYKVLDIYDISAGIRLSHEAFNIASTGDTLSNTEEDITQVSVYYDNKFRITDRIYTQLGINFVSYVPHNCRNYYSLQPRFSFKYYLNGKNILFLGLSKMEQFYHSLRLDLLPMPTDFRMPSVNGFVPSTSNHYEAGWKHFHANGYIEASLYYKKRDHIVAFRPDYVDEKIGWEKYIMGGNGQSFGAKYFMYYDWRKFTLQFSCALSRSLDRYPDLKGRGNVPSLYDIPAALNLAMTYKLAPHSGVSLGTFFQSGKVKDSAIDYETTTDSEFRTTRQPANYRIDLAYNYSRTFKSGSRLMLRAGIYNIVGNPSEEDMLAIYSVNWGNHCLPFGCISFKF